MKRSVFILLIVLNLLVINVIAQDIPQIGSGEIDPETGLPKEVEQIKDIGEKFSDEKERENFLKEKWGVMEEGGILGYINKLSVLDPFFEFAFGMKYSLSFLFFLNLVLWFFIVVFLFRVLEIFSLFSTWLRALVSVVANFLASTLGFIPWLSRLIIEAVSKMGVWWMQLIGWAIVVIAMMVAMYFSKAISGFFKRLKEGQEKTQERLNRERLKQDVKIAESFAKGVSGV